VLVRIHHLIEDRLIQLYVLLEIIIIIIILTKEAQIIVILRKEGVQLQIVIIAVILQKEEVRVRLRLLEHLAEAHQAEARPQHQEKEETKNNP
jgi:hypothetical protein